MAKAVEAPVKKMTVKEQYKLELERLSRPREVASKDEVRVGVGLMAPNGDFWGRFGWAEAQDATLYEDGEREAITNFLNKNFPGLKLTVVPMKITVQTMVPEKAAVSKLEAKLKSKGKPKASLKKK